VYGPAATSCADVIVVLGSERVRSDSHGAACASAAKRPTAVIVIMAAYFSGAGGFSGFKECRRFKWSGSEPDP